MDYFILQMINNYFVIPNAFDGMLFHSVSHMTRPEYLTTIQFKYYD